MDQKLKSRCEAQVRSWRDDLINLTRANRLLYYRLTRSASIGIVAPSIGRIYQVLEGGKHLSFWLPPTEPLVSLSAQTSQPKADEVVTDRSDVLTLDRGLRALERKVATYFNERGFWTMHLGLGMLDWEDPLDHKKVSTPLLLLPVTFNRTSLRDQFRIWGTDEDAVVNPALLVKMQTDFGIEIEADGDQGPGPVFRAIETAVASRGWTVNPRAVLDAFSFHKEAMYRDLRDNEQKVVSHPTVQLVALGANAPPEAKAPEYHLLSDSELEAQHPTRSLVSVLDADSSQRRCVVAAKQGLTLTIDGPPGTGKSQTITNIIAELLFANKSVLFVSEKAAALDVVNNRLKEVGLDDFCLVLHSHTANRKAVAQSLGQSLARAPRGAHVELDVGRLARREQELSAYANAINDGSSPLNKSLHEVLGRIIALGEAPRIPAPATGWPVPEELTRLPTAEDVAKSRLDAGPRIAAPGTVDLQLTGAQLSEITEHAERLGRAWGPVTRGRDFLWRDLADRSITTASIEARRRGALEAQQALGSLQTRCDAIAEELGTGWSANVVDAQRTALLLSHLDRRPRVPVSWLYRNELEDRLGAAVSGRAASMAVHEVQDHLGRLGCASPADIDIGARRRLEAVMASRTGAGPRFSAKATSVDLESLASRSEADAAMLEHIGDAGDDLARRLGARREDRSLERLSKLMVIAGLVGQADQPEERWLHFAELAPLEQAASVLGALARNALDRQEAMKAVFKPSVIELDLPALRARFTTVYKGLKKLGGAYRSDKRALAAHTVSGRVDAAVIAKIDDAAAYQAAVERFREAEHEYAPALGTHYYQGLATDFVRMSRAIESARNAVLNATDEIEAEPLARAVARQGSPDPGIPLAGQQLESALAGWHLSRQDEGRNPQIDELSTREIAQPLRRYAERCREGASLLSKFERELGRPSDLATMLAVIGAREELDKYQGTFEALADDLAARLGEFYEGITTNWDRVDHAVDWCRQLFDILGAVPPPPVAKALMNTTLNVEDITELLEVWTKRSQALLSCFQAPYVEDLEEAFQTPFGQVSQLLSRLVASAADAEEWITFTDEKIWFEEAGLGPVVDECVQQDVTANVVAMTIERAVLERWADSVLERDAARLSPIRSVDKDALVTEFDRLDRAQVQSTAPKVIDHLASRRPSANIGAAAVVKRESEKQRRHMPISTLMRQAGDAILRIKPCFMMSPLAVSQYIPADMVFDAVIFDEASQTRPADAINCIYRGRQLIVAGDERQLPPTSFFDRTDDGDDTWEEDTPEDFESILHLCKSSGEIPSLSLNWHYRSQHESLITFSNFSFYEGRLNTFPSAVEEGADVGVELIPVQGVYRRGAQRDNPVEAAKVVERVLLHQKEHPDLSIGVVAFSVAQQEAIQSALEETAQKRPELARILLGDRLDGFFVKNLESVQGDERDIILFSIGYGPDEAGKVTMNFGPINKPMGWRRLNVAITRARRRIEVITSIRSTDIDLDTENEGLRYLRAYLDYAVRGKAALELVLGLDKGRPPVSPIEREIARLLRSWGYEVDEQVGNASFRVDLAVRHPSAPGTYVLGIETDGWNYASSKVARDRDRLRSDVLTHLGWKLHHVWSTAWFHDPEGERRRLQQAIAFALNPERLGERAPAQKRAPAPVKYDERDLGERPSWTVPYQVVALAPPGRYVIDILSVEARAPVATHIEQIMAVEAPIHIDVLIERLRTPWRIQNVTQRIRATVEAIVARQVAQGVVTEDIWGALWRPNQKLGVVRVPVRGDPRTERRAAEVPIAEIGVALRNIVNAAGNATWEEVSVETARVLGWRRRGPDIQARIDDAVQFVLDEGQLVLDEGDRLRSP